MQALLIIFFRSQHFLELVHYEVSMQGLQTGAELIKAAGIFVKFYDSIHCISFGWKIRQQRE